MNANAAASFRGLVHTRLDSISVHSRSFAVELNRSGSGRRGSCRGQVGQVAPGFETPSLALFVPRECVPARVEAFESARGSGRDAERVSEQGADRSAVGDNDNRFARMPASQIFKAGNISLRGLAGALAAGQRVVGTGGFEEAIVVGELLFHLRFEQPLENPEMPFAEPRVRQNFMAGGFGNGIGGLPGAAEVAAVEGGELCAGQPLGQGAGLGFAPRREGAVEMALVTAFQVPGRFAVAQENDPCHWHRGN